MDKKTLYIFLDEGGNFDFKSKGTRYFCLSCITIQRPFILNITLDQYKYDLVEYGLDTEFFHCADDNMHVRDKVFSMIQENLNNLSIDSLIVEKSQTPLSIQDDKHFYPKMLGNLLRHVVNRYYLPNIKEIIVVTDTIPVNKKRKAIEKSIKIILAEMLPKEAQYRILHHASKAHYGLQIVDYCNWAIFRKWERCDDTYYRLIKKSLKSELNIFEEQLELV